MTITRNSIEDIKTAVLAYFGKERANELLAASIAVAHQAYSAAYRDFDDTTAKAYEHIITLKSMMVSSI